MPHVVCPRLVPSGCSASTERGHERGDRQEAGPASVACVLPGFSGTFQARCGGSLFLRESVHAGWVASPLDRKSEECYGFLRSDGGHLDFHVDGVLRESIGIETRGGVFTKLIERGNIIPAACSEVFTTADDNQLSIQIRVFRGDHSLAVENTSLGTFEVSGIAPARPGIPQIEVTFHVDADEEVSLSATAIPTSVSARRVLRRRLTRDPGRAVQLPIRHF